jgi:hypothetical protein
MIRREGQKKAPKGLKRLSRGQSRALKTGVFSDRRERPSAQGHEREEPSAGGLRQARLVGSGRGDGAPAEGFRSAVARHALTRSIQDLANFGSELFE